MRLRVFAMARSRQLLSTALPAALLLGVGGRSDAQEATYTGLGNVRHYRVAPGGIFLQAERGGVLVEALAGIGIRVRVRFGVDVALPFPVPHSIALADSAPHVVSTAMHAAGDTVVIAAEGLVVRAARSPLRLSIRDADGRELLGESIGAATWHGRLAHVVRSDSGSRYFGVGEQPTQLDRAGSTFPFWNTDRGFRLGEVPIYASFPFYVCVRDGDAHGVLYENPFKAELDFGGRVKQAVAYTAEGGLDGGELRFYVIRGPGLDSVLARYTRLTGRTPLPPRWALGYQQSRYSYYPDTMVANLAREFRTRRIPADVLYLDIHYMDEYRVFTWNPERFPRPRQLLDTLARAGFKVVTIVDPGVKLDSGYAVYRDGLARNAYVHLSDGSPYVGTVWPGRSVFPDFSRAAIRRWWGEQHSVLIDPGVAGIWNDMNEPAQFGGQTIPDIAQFDGDGHPGTHLEYHNQYGTLEARATYEGLRRLRPNRRPFIVTRAGYTGMQRYSSIWTGDNTSSWEHLAISLPMVLSLGLSGVPFAGSDIGGFNGAPSAELYARWLQSAALLPFCRTHATIGSPRREPWSFGPEYERANRATIRLRYQLLPALYTAFFQHTRDGSPVVRPLFWTALSEPGAFASESEYLLGDHLLIAPVVDSAADMRSVYLPAGRWYRLGTSEQIDGGKSITVTAPRVPADSGDTTGLRGLPVFARAGAVIPTQAVLEYVDQRSLDTLSIRVFPGAAAKSELYEDEGEGYSYAAGRYRLTTFTTADDGHRLLVTIEHRGSYPGAGSFNVTVPLASERAHVVVDGQTAHIVYDPARHEMHFTVPSSTRRIEIIR
ncbi:MAG: glycoside hydrolase family 31 protein [Gemmatimonadaceae bacterium]